MIRGLLAGLLPGVLCGFQASYTYRLETLTGADMPPEVPALSWNLNEAIHDVTMGPDGSVWFVEGDHLRKLTPDGRLINIPVEGGVRDYCPLPPGSSPVTERIAIGPGNQPYVARPSCSAIHRIRPDGSAEIVVENVNASQLVFDADGNLFFIQGYEIRKRDPRGLITAVGAAGLDPPLGPPNSLVSMAVDRQGNLYVAEGATPVRPTARIARIAPSGRATVMYSSSYVGWIGVDGSGAIYALGNGYFRIAPDRTVTELPPLGSTGRPAAKGLR